MIHTTLVCHVVGQISHKPSALHVQHIAKNYKKATKIGLLLQDKCVSKPIPYLPS